MNRISYFLALLIGVTFFSLPSFAFVDSWEIQAGTEFPASFGGRARLDFSDRMFGVIGVGFAPQFLTDINGSTVGGLGITGEATGDLIGEGFQNSWYIDLRAGVFPRDTSESGWYIDGGVSFFQSGGGDTDGETAYDALGEDPIYSSLLAFDDATINASTTNLVAHIGRKWVIEDWAFIGEVGFIKPIAADVEYDHDFISQFVREEVEEYVKDKLEGDYFIPTVSFYAVFGF